MNGQIDIGELSPWKYFMGAGLALGLVIGLSVPESSSRSEWLVLIQWIIQSLVTVGLLLVMQQLVQRVWRSGRNRPLLQLVLSGLLSALILSPPLLWLDITNGENAMPENTLELVLALLDELGGMGPPVILAWLAMNAPFLIGFKFVAAESQSNGQSNSAPFMALVEPGRQGRLISLQAELHYLKVTTDQGSSLILYNLKDAVSELPADLGIQCHRSYWAALAAIDQFTKKGRQGQLMMDDGGKIPVSRSCLSMVERVLAARPDKKAGLDYDDVNAVETERN